MDFVPLGFDMICLD